MQSNAFLIVHGDTGAITDPGGSLACGELSVAMTRVFPPQQLSAILASLDRRMTTTSSAKACVSRIWERFVPHFCRPGKTSGRIVGIPAAGTRIPIGRSELVALPAHFMHAEGNLQFDDPVSRILFCGDLGVSIITGEAAKTPVSTLAGHLPRMQAVRRRYRVSNKVLRLWVQRVRKLPFKRPSSWWGTILLKNSKVPALANQIAPMRRRHFVQRPAGPTAIEIAPASLCVALRTIDATRPTFELQFKVQQLHV